VLSPLLAVVAASIWLVVRTTEIGGVDALPGEYGKTGKVIALDAPALERSRRLAPLTTGRIDAAGGRLLVAIDADELPPSIEARLVHSTLPERDAALSLAWNGERFAGDLPAAIPDRGELHVFPPDRAWRLVAPIVVDEPLAFRASRR
jgi:hypothetical protein